MFPEAAAAVRPSATNPTRNMIRTKITYKGDDGTEHVGCKYLPLLFWIPGSRGECLPGLLDFSAQKAQKLKK